MPEGAAIGYFLRPGADRVGHRNMETAWLSTITLPARSAGNGKMAPQLDTSNNRVILV